MRFVTSMLLSVGAGLILFRPVFTFLAFSMVSFLSLLYLGIYYNCVLKPMNSPYCSLCYSDFHVLGRFFIFHVFSNFSVLLRFAFLMISTVSYVFFTFNFTSSPCSFAIPLYTMLVHMLFYTASILVCFYNKQFNVFMYFFFFAQLCTINRLVVVIRSSPFDVG